MRQERVVVAAGHICLDIIPELDQRAASFHDWLVPGSLLEVGPATLSTGGPVSNTGLALHRLGVTTRVMGKVGDDVFGDAIIKLVRQHGEALAGGMLVTPGEQTSYTVVLSPPGVDRVFLHNPGANDTFAADDVPYAQLEDACLFHFGYPPVMRRMYEAGGAQLEELFRRAKSHGVVTSLDMCKPDPGGPSGQVAWEDVLRRVVPHVDVFLPSVEEIVFMLDRAEFDRRAATGDPMVWVDPALLWRVSDTLLEMGGAVIGIKLGEGGFYVRTTSDVRRLQALAAVLGDALDSWRGRELCSPCFEAEVVGTTGCGDATIAGFLAALVEGLSLEAAITAAVGVGACNVEAPDSISGVPHWSHVQERIAAGWRKHAPPAWDGWRWDEHAQLAHATAKKTE